NFNSPGQVVIGGHAAAVDRALELLAAKGVRKAVKLAVSVPSHTPLMREAANRLAEAMSHLSWHEPSRPVVQNVDAEVHDGVQAIRDALVRQLYLPVQWTACVQALAARGATRIGECGPGKVLTGLARRIDRSLDARALGTAADFAAARAEWRGWARRGPRPGPGRGGARDSTDSQARHHDPGTQGRDRAGHRRQPRHRRGDRGRAGRARRDRRR